MASWQKELFGNPKDKSNDPELGKFSHSVLQAIRNLQITRGDTLEEIENYFAILLGFVAGCDNFDVDKVLKYAASSGLLFMEKGKLSVSSNFNHKQRESQKASNIAGPRGKDARLLNVKNVKGVKRLFPKKPIKEFPKKPAKSLAFKSLQASLATLKRSKPEKPKLSKRSSKDNKEDSLNDDSN